MIGGDRDLDRLRRTGAEHGARLAKVAEALAAARGDLCAVMAADTGKTLLCPMPGLVKSIAVTEGHMPPGKMYLWIQV